MKKSILAGAAALTILATPALAQTQCVMDPTGALVAGTVVGVGTGVAIHNGYLVSTATSTGLGVAGAAVGGFVAGVGAVVLVDMFTSPCRGFGVMMRPTPVAVARR